MRNRYYYVYILANKYNTVLYIGVTNNLARRCSEHKQKLNKGFTQKYNVDKLIYFEMFDNIITAIAREKQLKKLSRTNKNKLVNANNINWDEIIV